MAKTKAKAKKNAKKKPATTAKKTRGKALRARNDAKFKVGKDLR